ncbi:MAG: hypothetical protein QNK27_08430 [Desulfuromusa sp.]|nr:hypothetical protein [Desulfuromusa sp.]
MNHDDDAENEYDAEAHAHMLYGTTDPDEIKDIDEAQSYGYEEFRIGKLAELLKNGKKPKVRDIAYAMRSYSLVVWPKELREYTADLLMKKAGESTKGAIFSDDGSTWKNNVVIDSFIKSTYSEVASFFKKKGMSKVEMISVLAKAHVVGLLNLDQFNIDSIKELDLSEVERCWEKDDGDVEFDRREESAGKWKRRLDEIYYQRNR